MPNDPNALQTIVPPPQLPGQEEARRFLTDIIFEPLKQMGMLAAGRDPETGRPLEQDISSQVLAGLKYAPAAIGFGMPMEGKAAQGGAKAVESFLSPGSIAKAKEAFGKVFGAGKVAPPATPGEMLNQFSERIAGKAPSVPTAEELALPPEMLTKALGMTPGPKAEEKFLNFETLMHPSLEDKKVVAAWDTLPFEAKQHDFFDFAAKYYDKHGWPKGTDKEKIALAQIQKALADEPPPPMPQGVFEAWKKAIGEKAKPLSGEVLPPAGSVPHGVPFGELVSDALAKKKAWKDLAISEKADIEATLEAKIGKLPPLSATQEYYETGKVPGYLQGKGGGAPKEKTLGDYATKAASGKSPFSSDVQEYFSDLVASPPKTMAEAKKMWNGLPPFVQTELMKANPNGLDAKGQGLLDVMKAAGKGAQEEKLGKFWKAHQAISTLTHVKSVDELTPQMLKSVQNTFKEKFGHYPTEDELNKAIKLAGGGQSGGPETFKSSSGVTLATGPGEFAAAKPKFPPIPKHEPKGVPDYAISDTWKTFEPALRAKFGSEQKFKEFIGDDAKKLREFQWQEHVGMDQVPRTVPGLTLPEGARELEMNLLTGHGTKYQGKDEATGALTGEFDKLKIPANGEFGVHFGNPKANTAFTRTGAVDSHTWAPRVYPTVIRSNNPLRMDDMGSWYPRDIESGLLREIKGGRLKNISEQEVRHAMKTGDTQEAQRANLRDLLDSKGYDSIVYRNKAPMEDAGHDSYILYRESPEEPGYVQGARSRWAEFNPAKKTYANLLAGLGGLSLLAPEAVNELTAGVRAKRKGEGR